MVFEFLKDLEKKSIRLLEQDKKSLEDINREISENIKFIEMLEKENEKVFRDFTPRELDNKNARKIEELKSKQIMLLSNKEKIEKSIEENENNCKKIRDSLEEVKELQSAAEDSKWFEENVYNPGIDGEPDIKS